MKKELKAVRKLFSMGFDVHDILDMLPVSDVCEYIEHFLNDFAYGRVIPHKFEVTTEQRKAMQTHGACGRWVVMLDEATKKFGETGFIHNLHKKDTKTRYELYEAGIAQGMSSALYLHLLAQTKESNVCYGEQKPIMADIVLREWRKTRKAVSKIYAERQKGVMVEYTSEEMKKRGGGMDDFNEIYNKEFN